MNENTDIIVNKVTRILGRAGIESISADAIHTIVAPFAFVAIAIRPTNHTLFSQSQPPNYSKQLKSPYMTAFLTSHPMTRIRRTQILKLAFSLCKSQSNQVKLIRWMMKGRVQTRFAVLPIALINASNFVSHSAVAFAFARFKVSSVYISIGISQSAITKWLLSINQSINDPSIQSNK